MGRRLGISILILTLAATAARSNFPSAGPGGIASAEAGVRATCRVTRPSRRHRESPQRTLRKACQAPVAIAGGARSPLPTAPLWEAAWDRFTALHSPRIAGFVLEGSTTAIPPPSPRSGTFLSGGGCPAAGA